ncbi:MAG: hypothetical protein ACKV2O_21140 [Acidimicrobiales bacterium]
MVVWIIAMAMYLPSLAMRFGLYDDYRNAGADDLLRFDVGDGRPLAAPIHALLFHHADRFSEFVWVRAVAVTLIGLATASLWALLRRSGLPVATAAALAVCAAATVSTQIVAAWGVTLVVAPMAALLGGYGGRLLWQGTDRASIAGFLGRRHRHRIGLGIALLLSALCLYQPASMSCFLVLFVAQATEVMALRARVLRLAQFGASAASCFVAYFLIWKVGAALTNRSGARGQLMTDPVEKLQWFWEVALRRAFQPFSLSSSTSVPLLIAAVLLAALGIGLHQKGPLTDRFGALVAAAGCFVLAYAPNLATAESWASSRSLVVLMPMAVLAFGVGGWGLTTSAVGWLNRLHPSRRSGGAVSSARLWTAALSLMAVVAMVRAQSNVTRYVMVSNAVELAAFEEAVRAAAALQPDEIVLVPSEWGDTIAPGVSFDEFGYPATAATWALEPMARSAVQDVNYRGRFRVINRVDLPNVPEGAVVIDAKIVLARIDTSPPGM